MSSRTFDGNSESAGPGFCPAPPPPPPLPVPGQVPALRINTVEAPTPRRSLPISNNNPYEPPAAIQNAMMTKDKKPFTYTPGMGGKLDLSQIRSPRMARRVAKNANDEGIEGPPKSSLAAEPRPVSAAPNLYIQPQVAVPVFPTNVQLQPTVNRSPSAPTSRVPSNASDRSAETQRPVTRVETKMIPTSQMVSPQPTPPETPTTPPQVTLAKAPTPWLQNKNKPQEELPEWAKRSSVIRPSSSTSPESPGPQTIQIQMHQAQPQVVQTIQLQQPPSPPTRQQYQQPAPPPRQQTQPQERVIPLRIEDRPSVFSVKNEPGHHQFKQQPQQPPSPHHQQRWGNPTPPQTPVQVQMPQYQNQNHQQYQQPPRPQSSGGGTYIVPIMVEGSNGPSASPYNQQQPIQSRSQTVQNPSPRVIVQRGPPSPQIQQQGEPGPVQSRSFRVLQKITDTDAPDEVDGEQLRKLQLTEDDKILMNKFKEQVDGDGNYLHQEEDPRYRGAAIPSRAFRFLQNMTDSGDVTTTANAPRAPSAINKRQNRNSRTFEETQANLPASEQQAPEPKKYTGSAIPSRSFRILQAMTSPESIAKQENRQAVITCRTDTSMQPGNQQQGIFLSATSPHDSASLPQLQQSQLPSQFNTPNSQSSRSQAFHTHNSQSSDTPSSQLRQCDVQSQAMHSHPLQILESQPSQLALSQTPPSQTQTSRIQPTDTQSSQLQRPTSQDTRDQVKLQQSESQSQQLQELHLSQTHPQMESLQLSQMHPSLPMLPPPFWQNPDGNCWWSYYPIHYPPTPNATASSSSSLSSTPANNHPSTSHNSPATAYESYACCTGCHHHHHRHQNGNAFAYYHPFYDQRLYAAATAAAIAAASATGIASSDADAAIGCTDLQSSSSSSLNEATSAKTLSPRTLAPEDSSSSSQLLFAPSAPSTILHRATGACLVPAFARHQTAKALPGYDSNCNPCLGRTERSCAADKIFGCPPVYLQNASNSAQEFPGCGGSDARSEDQEEGCARNNWNNQDPGLTEPGPPPWIHINGTEVVAGEETSEVSVGQGNEVGWNLDGSIETLKNSPDHQTDERFLGSKVKQIETGLDRTWRSDQQSAVNRPDWSRSDGGDRVDKQLEDEEPRWNGIDMIPNFDDRNSKNQTPMWTRQSVEDNRIVRRSEVEESECNGNSVKDDRIDYLQLNGNKFGVVQVDQHFENEEPKWNRIDNASRNLSEIDASIPMNILHEERNVNESPVIDKVENNESGTFDRSEDTNATDSYSETESSTSDSSADAEPVCTDPATNTDDASDTETDSDDSDSYLAYSTGLNPHNVFARQPSNAAMPNRAGRDSRKSQTAIAVSEEVSNERSLAMSSDRLNATDCESCVEEDDAMEEDAKNADEQNKITSYDQSKAEEIAMHRLSVIPEDSEKNYRRGASPNAIGCDGWQIVPEDNNPDSATVSVSLPLKFRVSVAETEQDVTSVIVADDIAKNQTPIEDEENTDVCVKLKLGESADTSVDFTLTKNILQKTEKEETEKRMEGDEIDFWSKEDTICEERISTATKDESETEEKISISTQDETQTEEEKIIAKKDESENEDKISVATNDESENEEKIRDERLEETNEDPNPNSKSPTAQDDTIDFWETITSGRVTPDSNYYSKRERNRVDRYPWGETDLKEEEEEEGEILKTAEYEDINDHMSPIADVDDSRFEEEIEAEEKESESEVDEVPEEETMRIDENEEVSSNNATTPLFELTEAKNDDTEESSGRSNLENCKHLLSVQNSRDETDDEDSGVTSDMSRLISEVDTDSECGPTRKINSYKRTQTHSRLFRLLSREDDVQGAEETSNSSARRDRLSLPLKRSTGFSYDESNHCSNYSSGLTSPDYSPVHESTWRRLHDEENPTTEKPSSPAGLGNDDESSDHRKDPYFENWKKIVTEDKLQEEKIVLSRAFKLVDNGTGVKLPNWRFRTNVLCPRIKSTKNVPRTVRHNRSAKPVISIHQISNSVGKSVEQ